MTYYLIDDDRKKVDISFRKLLHGSNDDFPKPKIFTLNRGQLFPEKMLFMEYRFDGNENWWPWLKSDDVTIDSNGIQLNDILVPTKETNCCLYWLNESISANISTILVGQMGTGKTTIANHFLRNLSNEKYLFNVINLSANIKAERLQETIMTKLDRRRKGVFGPPVGKFVSDERNRRKNKIDFEPRN